MGTPTSAIGFNTIYGWTKFNADGTVSFGTTNEAEERYAVLLKNNEDPIHKFEMFNKGANKGRTHIHAPKGMSFITGLKNKRVEGAILIQSHHGNITIDCQDGDFRVKARNICLRSEYGEDKESGNLSLYANNKIKIESTMMEQFAKEQISITSNNILRLHGVIQTQMISGIAQMTSWSSIAGKLPLLAPPTTKEDAAAIASAQLAGLGKAWPGTPEEAEASGRGVDASKPSTNEAIQNAIGQHKDAAVVNAATAAKGQGGAS